MYAILDIETTGGLVNEEGITEIAIYRFDGKEVVDKFITMVNPERPIQDFVVRLTGITNKMLRSAPKFYEIAKRVVEITEGCIIVAHNAEFDYRILRTEFRRLGFEYQRETICTVELSKKLIPDMESYSLGKLVKALCIPIANRHRAYGDALATVELFKLLLAKDINKDIIGKAVRSEGTKEVSYIYLRILDTLPSSVGVYYVYDKEGKLIYIGKGFNIRKKVNRHFVGNSRIDKYIQENVGEVMFEETGSELIAQIKEYEEVKANYSYLNIGKEKNRIRLEYGLVEDISKEGYIKLSVEKVSVEKFPIMKFESLAQGHNTLFEMTKKYKLCTKMNGFSQAHEGCYDYSQGECLGACVGEEEPEEYNKRVIKALEDYAFYNKSFAIVERGRTEEEKSVVVVERGRFLGYGYVSLNYQMQMEILKNIITRVKEDGMLKHMVQRNYRKISNKKEKIKLL